MTLEVRGIRFSYGGREVLKGVDMDVPEGVTALLGPNGAGKSTLVKCLAGVYKPSEGTALFNGDDLLGRAEDRPNMAYLAQDTPKMSDSNVLEVMLLGRAATLGLRVAEEDVDAAYGALETMGISELAGRDVSELSGGQMQMVMIAQCLVSDPELLILDEPMNNLDLRRELEMFEVVTDIAKEKKLTSLMVLHDVNFAACFADCICVLKDGAVHSAGSPEDVVTEEMLRDVYGVEANLGRDSFGNPQVEAVCSIHGRRRRSRDGEIQ